MNHSARRLNAIAKALGLARYIEIGVFRGETFFSVDVLQKTGVDPHFQFSAADHCDANTRFFEKTSDEFFMSVTRDTVFDLYYIDGLHVFEQVLRDFNNAMLFSEVRTVYLIDDTKPCDVYSTLRSLSKACQYRKAAGDNSSAWHGDVFKLVYYIHDFLPLLDYRTISGSGNSQTLVWRSSAEKRTPRFNDLEQISRLSYFDFQEDIGILRECGEEEAIQRCVRGVLACG